MDLEVLGIIIIAFLGPLLIYLTRYVLKGKTVVASRIWFVSFCTFVIYYWLAKGYFISTTIEPFYFALLWPIAAILTYWFSEKAGGRDSPIPYFRWMIYFIAGILFAFVLDTIASYAGWYTYNASIIASTAISNPVSGTQTPAIVLLMLGVLMLGVFFLIDNAYEFLKAKVGGVTTTYLLIALSFIVGGLVWVISDFLMKLKLSSLF